MSIDSQKHIQFINSLKFDPSSTFHTSKAKSYKHATSMPQALSMEQLQRKNEDILQMAVSHLHLPQTTRRDGIARHHLQSIRLRLGDWFQLKNIPLLSNVVDDFQKQLKLQQTSEEEEHMKQKKILIQYEFEMKKVEQIQRLTAQNLNHLIEQKSLTYNIDLDEFWKQMKDNMTTKIKSRVLEKWENKFTLKKCYFPQMQKLEVKEQGYYDL